MRTKIPLKILNPDTSRPESNAQVEIVDRVTNLDVTVYDGPTSSGEVTQPILSDSSGRVAGWLERGVYKALITPTDAPQYDEFFDSAPGGDGAVDGAWLGAGAATQAELDAEAALRVIGDTRIPIVNKGADFQFALVDAGKNHHVNSASAVVATVAADADVNFPVETILGLGRFGAGSVTVAAAAGVTIHSKGGLLAIADQFGFASLQKIAANEYWLVGDLA